MLRFSALVPDATVNYVTNPALRYDTTGWNAQGSAITRSLEQARFGIASLKVVTNGAATREGTFFRVSSLSNISEAITVSVYARGAGKVRARLIANPTGTERFSDSVFLRSDRWTRLSVTGRSIGSNDVRIYIETDEGSAKVRTFYVDGAQMERKAYPTTYCDGDQPGCRWNGIYHNSASQRNAYTREGGRWVQLAGEEREEQDLYMTVVGGLGVAPLINNVQSFALAPGSYFQNMKIQARPMTLTFHAKHNVNDIDEPVSLAALHQLRQLLIDVVKPDKTGGNEEIWFEYNDGNTPLYFQARYEGGLEGDWDIRNQFINSFPLRLLAVSPLLQEDSQESSVIDFQNTLNNIGQVIQRKDGIWINMNQGFDLNVNDLVLGPDGKIYAAGEFQQILNPPGPVKSGFGIAYWDGYIWTALNTTAIGGGMVNAVAIATNGYVYVAGTFTLIGGIAANRIAYWNGSAWNALGSGLNGGVNTIKFSSNGDLYVGGSFTTAGGVSCAFIARWDGLQWRRVGQYGGLNSTVQSIDITPDGAKLYVGGVFTDQNGLAANALKAVAQYDVVTGLFSAMGNGFVSSVNGVLSIHISQTGGVFAGGTFILSGSETINRIAKWNRSAWTALGGGVGGVNESVNDISSRSNGDLLIVGNFTEADGRAVSGVTLWNGSAFYPVDISLAGSNTGLIHPATDDIFLGGSYGGAVSANISGITTIQNPGTAEAFPVFYVFGPGNLFSIENQTTGKIIYFNLAIQDDEEIFINVAKGIVESTVRGSLFYTLIAGSDFRSFSILPGENKLAVFMDDDVNAQMSVTYQPRHWSVDATQHGDSL